MSSIVLEAHQLSKVFKDAGEPVEVFNKLDLQVKTGDSIAIVGRSGSGKSSLLHLLGGLEMPTSGEVRLHDKPYQDLNEKEKSRLRNQHLGFIYQFHHLLPEFTAVENVSIPLLLRNANVADAQAQASRLLEKVGLKNRLQHKVAQLSGGERQRVAIVRALVTNPSCVLADEPTGNLDGQTADNVFETMLTLNRELGTSLVIVTHDQALARRMDKMYMLENGKLHRQ